MLLEIWNVKMYFFYFLFHCKELVIWVQEFLFLVQEALQTHFRILTGGVFVQKDAFSKKSPCMDD